MSKLIYFIAITVILFLAPLFKLVAAEIFNENQITAAYIVNFVKHINWPNESQKQHYQITIYNDRDFYVYFSNALKNKQLKNKAVIVSYATALDEINASEVVFVTQTSEKGLNEIANSLRGRETLLISQNSSNKHDTMINLIQTVEQSNITFEVNKSNILYEKLSMSADLLLLGGSELDVAMLYRETEMAMQATREQSLKLKNTLVAQELQIQQTTARLQAQEQQIEKASTTLAASKEELRTLNVEYKRSSLAAQQQKLELLQLKRDVSNKQSALVVQQVELEQASSELDKIKQALVLQQEALTQKEIKSQNVLALVEKNNAVLAQQKTELAIHKRQLAEQEQDITLKKETITNQRTYLVITSVLAFTVMGALLLVILFFLRNRKTTQKLTQTLAHLNDAQSQLIQSEKMASLGRLVAGVAHEINTPLGIAITANSLVLDETLEVKAKINEAKLSKTKMNSYIAKAEQSLTMSEKSLGRVRVLLANFKQVAADQIVMDEREIDLVAYIDEVMATLSVEMNKHRISYFYTGLEKVKVTTLPGVFAQVLTNLVINSIIHGFDGRESGEIRIKLMSVTCEDNKDRIKLIYCDNGKGMNEHTLKNIFEPFFTTKRGTGSTGLGMNIVYNIINQQLKGNVDVASIENKSTTISITLPLAL